MTALPQHVTLHEATVKAAEQHVGAYQQPRRRAAETRPRASQVVTQYLAHPLVWATALKAAHGDASRLHVVDYETVVVR